MKNLEKFNLEIAPLDIVVSVYPTEVKASSLIKPDTVRPGRERFEQSVPLVVTMVGEGVNTDPESRFKLNVGDLVYVHEMHLHSCVKLGMDEERTWKNPIIMPAFAVAAKVPYTKEWETIFQEVVDKTEATIKAREERIAATAKK